MPTNINALKDISSDIQQLTSSDDTLDIIKQEYLSNPGPLEGLDR